MDAGPRPPLIRYGRLPRRPASVRPGPRAGFRGVGSPAPHRGQGDRLVSRVSSAKLPSLRAGPPPPRVPPSTHDRGRPLALGYHLAPVIRAAGPTPQPGADFYDSRIGPDPRETQPGPPIRSARVHGHPRASRLTSSSCHRQSATRRPAGDHARLSPAIFGLSITSAASSTEASGLRPIQPHRGARDYGRDPANSGESSPCAAIKRAAEVR
jgi:hypothetical protein